MDLHHGKYSSSLAILAEGWAAQGDFGHAEFSDDNGEGCVLYQMRPGFGNLRWSEARTLMKQEQASFADLDELDNQLSTALGVLLSWDDRGFVHAVEISTPSLFAETEAEIASMNEALAREEENA